MATELADKPKRTRKPKAEPVAETTLLGVKGFNRDLTCRGFQFAIGERYEVSGRIEACRNGFHAVPDDLDPLTVLRFYAPGTSRYCVVEQSGTIVRHEDDKAASSVIVIKPEIGLGELIDRAVKYRIARATETVSSNSGYSGAASNSGYSGAASNSGYSGAASNSGYSGAASNSGYYGAASNSGDSGAASNSGYYGAASNSGYSGAASNSGYSGAASNSGYYGAASNSGYYGAASNSGDSGAASNSGYSGAASNSGYSGAASNSGYYGAASNSGARGAAFSHAPGSKVMCEGDGQALYCTEFADDRSIKSVACGITGRDGITAGTWYRCENGKLIAARGE